MWTMDWWVRVLYTENVILNQYKVYMKWKIVLFIDFTIMLFSFSVAEISLRLYLLI